jgi:hypothetical protein
MPVPVKSGHCRLSFVFVVVGLLPDVPFFSTMQCVQVTKGTPDDGPYNILLCFYN